MADQIDIATSYAEEANQACLAARVRYTGESRSHCRECEEEIPERRRQLLPGVQLCVDCQAVRERSA